MIVGELSIVYGQGIRSRHRNSVGICFAWRRVVGRPLESTFAFVRTQEYRNYERYDLTQIEN